MRHHRSGFSLIELVMVLAVAIILTSMLFPVLAQVRENVNRVLCGSNMRQQGLAFTMFARDHNDQLPPSRLLREELAYEELMAANTGKRDKADFKSQTKPWEHENGWDGIGLLFAGGYCASPECYYCPSHVGEHTLDRYEDKWRTPDEDRIYTNYHYSGDVEWENPSRLRRFEEGDALVLASDGLRTLSDFNHVTGLNLLHGDGSVRWLEDSGTVSDRLPISLAQGGADRESFKKIWRELERR